MRPSRVHRVVESLASERSLLVAFSICLVVCMGLLLYFRNLSLEPQLAPGPESFETLKSFERQYIVYSLGGFATTAMILLGAVGLRLKFRKVTAREPAFTEDLQSSSLWLLGIVGLSSLIFAIDVQVPLGTAIGILYLFLVIAAQRSGRRSHVWIAAALGTALIVTKLFLAERVTDMWAALANCTLSVFALWTVAALGQWQRRTDNLKAMARAEVEVSQAHNRDLQAALTRIEATEAKLRRGQQVMETVAHMARLGSWELDVRTMKSTWSSEVFRIHELTGECEPSVEKAMRFYPEPQRSSVAAAVKAAIETGCPFDLTIPFVTLSGRPRWVRAFGSAEYQGTQIVKLNGAFQDVTEVQETHARLTRTIRGSRDGIWEQNLRDGSTWVSPRFLELAGAPADTANPRILETLLHPDDLLRFEVARDVHLGAGEALDLELRLRRPDGEFTWFRMRASAERDAHGIATTLSGSIRDISLQREAQGALTDRVPPEDQVTDDTAEVSGPVIDLARLRQVADDDAEFMADVAKTFVDSANDIVTGIERASRQRELHELSILAHKLRGSSQSVGAVRVTSLSMQIEEAVRFSSDVVPMVQQLRKATDECVTYLKDHLLVAGGQRR
jgi:PAS domain S-box-containing protein